MTDPDGQQPARGFLSWIRRIFRPDRPERPPIGGPERDISRETLRSQVEEIRRAFEEQVAIARGTSDDDADAEFLYRPGHVLVRRGDRERLDRFFGERQGTYNGLGRVVDDRVPGLDVYELPERISHDPVDVLEVLDELHGELRERGELGEQLEASDEADGRGLRDWIATPDHVLYVVASIGKLCPATEPDLPPQGGPVPARNEDDNAGKGIRVSVVDTGWYDRAAHDSDTPWVASGVQGDIEQVDETDIHKYAGHGTFVAGVIKCLAPGAEIEVEGVLERAGAVLESEIAAELLEAVNDQPDLISISAGTHTYKNNPLMGFEALYDNSKKAENQKVPLVIAAAGNDGNNQEFWPAAFHWVVSVGSLDANGKRSTFSNYGPWVDVYAQGSDLVNAFPTGRYVTKEAQTPPNQVRDFTGLAKWSGTSFATPIVTGAIAAYMSKHGGSARAARDALIAAAPTKQDAQAGTMKAMGPPFV